MSAIQQNSAVAEVHTPGVLHWLSAANSWAGKKLATKEAPKTTYFLHTNPPYAVFPLDKYRLPYIGQPANVGMRVKVELGGPTYLLSGDTFLPLNTQPAPHVALSLALRVWWARKPLEVLAAITAVLLLSAFFMALMSLSSPNSEYTATLAWGASQGLALLFYGGCVIALLCLVGFAMWNFGKGITIGAAAPAEQKLLSAGELPGIGSDIPIFALENETPAAFAQRMADASREAVEGQMVVAIPFRSPYVVAFQKVGENDPELGGKVTRWNLAHKKEQCYAEGADVSQETYAEYLQFVRWYADGFEQWAASVRIERSRDAFKSMTQLMSRMSAILLLLLASVSVSAQGNIQKVEAYLGDVRAAMKPRGEVQFLFVGRVITRKADGSKSFVEVLQIPSGVRPFDNNEALGKLLAISNNGVMLEPVNAAQPEARPTRAASVAQPVSALPIPASFDSTNVSNSLEEGGRAVGSAFRAANSVMKKWWQSDLCTYLLHILAALAGTLHMVAQICYNEHRMTQWGHIYGRWAFNIGNAAAFALMFITLPTLVAVALLIYIAFVEYEGFALYYIFCVLWNVWTLLLILWFILIRVIVRAADFIIPNPKVRPTHGGPSYPSQHSPRLGSGQ